MKVRQKLAVLGAGVTLAGGALGIAVIGSASASTPPVTHHVASATLSTVGGPDIGTADGAEKAIPEADTGPDSGPGGGGDTQSGSQVGGADVGGSN